MGTFKNWFQAGAGATLGSLTASTSFELAGTFVGGMMDKSYVKYRAQYFDHVVRADLNDIMVRGMLPEKSYPFPNKDSAKGTFFKRHKRLKVILIAFAVLFFLTTKMAFDKGEVSQSFITFMSLSSFALLIYAIYAGIRKVFHYGKKVAPDSLKAQLDTAGEQYWYIREYIRQTLSTGELTPKDAILKMSNTRLGQQFPDTVEEIEAHAFYYKQQLGL